MAAPHRKITIIEDMDRTFGDLSYRESRISQMRRLGFSLLQVANVIGVTYLRAQKIAAKATRKRNQWARLTKERVLPRYDLKTWSAMPVWWGALEAVQVECERLAQNEEHEVTNTLESR